MRNGVAMAVLWTCHGHCTREFTAAVVTCTRSWQQDQSTFHQVALMGLNGLSKRETVREGRVGGGVGGGPGAVG